MIFALPAGWTLAKVLWKAAPYIVIALLAFALWGVWGWKEAAQKEAKSAKAALATAVSVNKENAVAMEKLRRQQESDRRMVAKSIEEAKARAAATAAIKKEQRNAPDANDRLSPYWGDFFDRLRQQQP